MSTTTPELLDPTAEQEPIAPDDTSDWKRWLRATVDEVHANVHESIAQYAAAVGQDCFVDPAVDTEPIVPEDVGDDLSGQEASLCRAVEEIRSGDLGAVARHASMRFEELDPRDAVTPLLARHVARTYEEGLKALRAVRASRRAAEWARIAEQQRNAGDGVPISPRTAAEEAGFPNAGA